MKTALVYESKTGFTQIYAEWIAEALAADLVEVSGTTVAELSDYDTLIFGGGIYPKGITGFKPMIKHGMDTFAGKNLVVFAVGATPASDDYLKEVEGLHVPAVVQDKVKLFYVQGGYDFSKLKFFEKFLMMMLKMKLGMRDADAKWYADFTDEAAIAPLVAYVNGLSK